MSEKLLIQRLKSLAEEVRGPVREALLDAAMALTEADRDALRYRFLRDSQRLVHLMAPIATGAWPVVIDNTVDALITADSASGEGEK